MQYRFAVHFGTISLMGMDKQLGLKASMLEHQIFPGGQTNLVGKLAVDFVPQLLIPDYYKCVRKKGYPSDNSFMHI